MSNGVVLIKLGVIRWTESLHFLEALFSSVKCWVPCLTESNLNWKEPTTVTKTTWVQIKGSITQVKHMLDLVKLKHWTSLHIINYTWSQIKISPNVEQEMERLRQNCLPQLPTNLFESDPGHIKLLHINIGNIHRKILDMKSDRLVKS